MTNPGRMVKLYKSIILPAAAVMLCIIICASQAFAQPTINESCAILSVNGGAASNYNLKGTTHPDFDASSIGTFTIGTSSLLLNGALLKTSYCPSDIILNTTLYYRIYPSSEEGSAFLSTGIPSTSETANAACSGGKDGVWESTGANINVLSGLAPGSYYLEVYTGIEYGGGTIMANNNGANYIAYFTVQANDCAISNTVSPTATQYLCIGSPTSSLTATITTLTGGNGSGNISYEWYSNTSNSTLGGTLVQGPVNTTTSTTSNSFTLPNSIAGTLWYYCVVTNLSASCLGTSYTTTLVGVTVNATLLIPTVTIAANPGNSICAGTSVTFTATAGNAGTNPGYQWKINGSNVGTNSSVFTTSALTNGQKVTVVVSSDEICPGTKTSNEIIMTVNPVLIPSVSLTAAPNSSICAGTLVTFYATPTNGGTSPVYEWKLNGTVVGTNSTQYSSSALADGDIVSLKMTSNAVCAAPLTALASITMTVDPLEPVSVGIAASATNICAGTPVTFTATPVNGGSPAYQWKVNGSNVGGNSNVFTSSILAQGDAVSVAMTSDINCPSVSPATSNLVNMTVNPILPVNVNISPSASSICTGSSVTFTATPFNGGVTPVYQWKLNGVDVGSNSPTYTNPGLTDGNSVHVILTSSASCTSGNPATSAAESITVNPYLPVSVSIAASATTICAGTAVTFSATPTNGGTIPFYQWKVNGLNAGTNSSSFISSSLSNNDQVTVVLTAGGVPCPTGNPATSNTIAMTVNPSPAVSVSIAASSTTICPGTLVTFTATPTNGGTPTYQWKVNGGNVGTSSNVYTSTILNQGDLVTVVMTSNISACASNNPATSNIITMTVNPNLPVSVSIAASATTICAGTSVTFTATPTNGGPAPSYQWKVNGLAVGINLNTFTSTGLVNNDQVSVVLTSNATPCATGSPTNSNTITMTVNPNLPASVSIAASATTICAGTSVTFTATPVNGGSPNYQWRVNGANVGTNSSSYASNSLANGNSVTVVMTSSANPCVTGNPATSNAIVMTVNALQPVSVSINASATTICAGSSVTFTATPTNGGTTPAYQWYRNGGTVGSNSNTYTSSALVNGDIISAQLTSNINCASGNPTTSNLILMTVNPNAVLTRTSAASTTAQNVCRLGNITNITYSVVGATSYTLTGLPPGIISSISGGVITISGSPNNTIGSTTTYNYTLTTTGFCANVSSTGSINVFVGVPAIGNGSGQSTKITGVSSICPGPNATGFVYNAPSSSDNVQYYLWSLPPGFVITAGDSTSSITLSVTGPGSIIGNNQQVKVTLVNPCGNYAGTAAFLVNVNSFNAVNAGANFSICSGTNPTLTNTISGAATRVTWATPSSGTISGGPYPAAYVYTPSISSGTVTLTVRTDTASGNCSASAQFGLAQVTITINQPPAITIQPAPLQSVCSGSTVNFTVVATGSGLGYQWKKNGTNLANGGNVSGATSATLSLSNTTTADAATYTVQVNGTSPCGFVTSNNAVLSVTQGVTISTQPIASQTACSGTPVSFNVITSGATPTFYQWKKNGVGLIDGGNVVDANNVNLVLTTVSASDVANYTVELGATAPCANITSNNSALVVIAEVAISSQPSSQTVCTGANVNFSVAATGAGLSYQWRKNGTPLSNGANVSGATSTSLTLNNVTTAESATYTVVVSGTNPCSPVTSSNAVLTVNQPVAISSQPAASQTLCSGSSASITVVATGTGLTYQWRKNGTPLSNGGNISGATSATLNLSNIISTDAATYTVVVSGAAPCTSVTSANSVLIVNDVVVITSQPSANQTFCSGSNASFTVTATGTGLTYQWRKGGTNLTNGGNISGAISSTLSLTNVSVSDGGAYSVVISGTSPCTSQTSANANLVVNQPVTIISQPVASQSVCSGSSVSFSVSATGSGLSYQWKKAGIDLVNGGNISGATSSTLTINPVMLGDAAADYSVTVSGLSPCSPVNSNNAALQVTEGVIINTQPTASLLACYGTAVSFTVDATGAGLSYQWRKGGINISDGGNITGTNTATLSLTNVISSNSGTYSVIISGTSPCGPVTSNNAALSVGQEFAITAQPVASQTICSGSSVSFSVSATGSGISYQWKKAGVNLVNGGNVSGATSAILTLSPVLKSDQASDYTVVVMGQSPCTPITSNNTALIVNEQVVITSQPIASQTVCSGSTVTFSVSALGDGLSYLWRKNGAILTDDGNTSGVNTPTLTLLSVNITAAANYTVVVNGLSPCAQVTSTIGTLVIKNAATITTQPSNTAVCSTFPSSLSMAASGDGISYQWYKGVIGSGTPLTNNSNITGVTSNILSFAQTGFADDGNYYVIVSGVSPCTPVTSNQVYLNVDQAIIVTSQPVSQTVCEGTTNISFSVSANAGADPLSFQWRKNGVNIPGANSTTYTIATAAVSDGGNYDCAITGLATYACASASSGVAVFIVNPIPNAIATPASQTLCSGIAIADIVITGNVPTTTYNWTRDNTVALTGIAGNSNGNISGTLTNTTTSPVSTIFTITPTSNGCTGASITSTVLVNPIPTVVASPLSQSICTGSSISSIVMTGTVSGTVFNWVRNNTAGVTGIGSSGSGNISGSLTNLTNAPITVTFTITASTASCSSAPITATVVVNPIPNVVATPPGTEICSQDNLIISLSGNVVGTTYNYTVVQTGVSGASNGSTTSNSILHTMVTTGVVNGTVSYTITPTFNGCTGTPVSFSVTVKPLPTGTIIAGVSGTVTVCQNAAQPLVTFTGSNGNPPYVFTYRINGGNSKTVSTGGGSNSVSINAPTDVPGVFDYQLVAVKHSTTVDCPQPASGSAVITVNPLPNATVTGTTTVCIGSASPNITFTGSNATGPYTFTYKINNGANQQVSTSAGNSVTVAAPTNVPGIFTYTLVNIQDGNPFSCAQNQSATAIVTVNDNSTITLTSAAGTSAQTVCINNPMTTTTYLVGGGGTGASITAGALPAGVSGSYNSGSKVFTISGTPSVSGTFSYTLTTAGPCINVTTSGTIIVKPVPVGGTTTNPSSTLACASNNSGTISLTGQTGVVSKWQSSTNGGSNWTDIANTATSITYTNLTQTAWYRAVMVEPACTGLIAYSSHSVVNVVPQSGPGSLTGISNPAIICTGSSTLTATGFGTPDNSVGRLNGGSFDLAGSPLEGPGLWRKMVNGSQINIEASADNTVNTPFNLTNGPKTFLTSGGCPTITYNNNPLGGFTNNNKFMIVLGPNICTLETPIFNLNGLTSASLDWWESYTLTAGASIKMEISTDAGVTYNTTLKTITGPTAYGNPIDFGQSTLNLSGYVGLSNLRVRFTYTGTTCSSWGLEMVTITKGFVATNYTWALYYPIPAGSNIADHYLNLFVNQSVVVTPPTPNLTNNPIVYQYSITSSAGGCATNINVTVNPVLVASATNNNTAFCTGLNMSAINFNANLTGTTYSWTRDKTTEVTGLASSGTGSSIASTALTNTTAFPQTVTFTVTPANVNGCSPVPFTTSLTVNPSIPVTLGGGGVVCPNNPATLTLTSGGPFPLQVTLSNGVTYNMNSSPTSISVSPGTSTTYTINSLPGNCATGTGSATVSYLTNPGITGTWLCTSGDGDWFNPCNWANFIIPTNNIDVIIASASSTCNPVIDPTTSYAAINGPIARSRNITISGTRNLSFRNGGDLYVAGNWINQVGTNGFTANTGTVTFMGNSNNTPSCSTQTITSTTGVAENYYNLVINNTCDKDATGDNVLLNNPVNVSGVFTLIDGIVKTSSTNILTITNTAPTAVVGGANITYVNGPMVRYTLSTGDYACPVGKPVYPYVPYRPAIVAPATTAATRYWVEYMAGTATPSIANRFPISILNSEYWSVNRINGTANAVVKLVYINPNNDAHWTNLGPSGCWYCNVAIVKAYSTSSNYWHFTNYPGLGGFNTSSPETRYWQNNGLILSQLISSFSPFNFTFGYDINTILPVNLLSFNGKLVNEDAVLTWAMADTKDLAGFDLEHSTDGTKFSKLSSINPSNTNNYGYTHSRPEPGSHYYRLLLKDKNGKNSYSKTVLLVLGKKITVIKGLKATIALGTAFAEIWSATAQKARIQIYDVTGRILDQQSGTLIPGENSLPIRLIMLPQGIYNIYIRTDDEVQKNLRLMKE